MNKKLSDIFSGAGAKRLSDVEIDPETSNQHEFNGVSQFKNILGSEKKSFSADFIYLADNEADMVFDSGKVTWYDARESHPKRSEYRLYFSENDVIKISRPDDLLIVLKLLETDKILVIVAKNSSTSESQLIWLFGFGKEHLETFHVNSFDDSRTNKLDFASKFILKHIGIEISDIESHSEYILEKYSGGFPSSKEFSNLSYNLLSKSIDEIKDPDFSIISLLEKEESLFRILEKHFVEKKIGIGFRDVDDFVGYSLSVQNRRKSRAGLAFENHLENIFRKNNIKFDMKKITESKSKPDFIFPGIKEYQNINFNDQNLSMLGVKTTCKDRWRQILTEANRIKIKHLATLEPSISHNQTNEMKTRNVILVIPDSLHKTFSSAQKNDILSLRDFINFIREQQKILASS